MYYETKYYCDFNIVKKDFMLNIPYAIIQGDSVMIGQIERVGKTHHKDSEMS